MSKERGGPDKVPLSLWRDCALGLLFDVSPQAGEVFLHGGTVFPGHDVLEVGQVLLYLFQLFAGVGVEENFADQVVVFREEAAGNVHVLLEGGTRGVLVLHDGGEYHGRGKRYGERVGYRLVVLLEGVLKDVEMQAAVQVFEENFSQMIRFGDDDGVLLGEVAEVGKRGAEHGVCRHKRVFYLGIEFR